MKTKQCKLRIVSLTGLPGSGKSTVGALLARKLSLYFGDTDSWIEQAMGSSIEEIFDSGGEAMFRYLERSILEVLAIYCSSDKKELVLNKESNKEETCYEKSINLRELVWSEAESAKKMGGMVLATGGGAIISARNRKILQEISTSLFLECAPETIALRLEKEQSHDPSKIVSNNCSRPLLKNGKNPISQEELISRLYILLSSRQSLYEQATSRIETDNSSPEKIVANIEENLRILAQE